MSDRAAIILTYLALGIAAVIVIAAFVIRWALSGSWYSVEGTEIDRNIRRAARTEACPECNGTGELTAKNGYEIGPCECTVAREDCE